MQLHVSENRLAHLLSNLYFTIISISIICMVRSTVSYLGPGHSFTITSLQKISLTLIRQIMAIFMVLQVKGFNSIGT